MISTKWTPEYTAENITRAENLLVGYDDELGPLRHREDYLSDQLDQTRDRINRLERERQPYADWLDQAPDEGTEQDGREVCPDCGGEPHFHFCGGEQRGGGDRGR